MAKFKVFIPMFLNCDCHISTLFSSDNNPFPFSFDPPPQRRLNSNPLDRRNGKTEGGRNFTFLFRLSLPPSLFPPLKAIFSRRDPKGKKTSFFPTISHEEGKIREMQVSCVPMIYRKISTVHCSEKKLKVQ